MDKKSILFGMGFGITLICVILLPAYFLTNNERVVYTPVELSDDEVIERAKRLGFVSLLDINEESYSNDTDMLKALFDKGLVKKIDDTYITSEDIIEKAKALGMRFVEEDSSITVTANDENYHVVTILPGYTSSQIVNLLFDNGIISDKNAMEDLIVKRNMSKKLPAGVFNIKVGATIEEVLEAITTQ